MASQVPAFGAIPNPSAFLPRIRLHANALQARYTVKRLKIEKWCKAVELAPDLTRNIGSHTWLRGVGTLAILIGLSLAVIPDFTSVEAASMGEVSLQEREEFQSRSITPLALGADNGRRMGSTSLMRPLADEPERPTIDVIATLRSGNSLKEMLERIGVGPSDQAQVVRLIGMAVNLDEIPSGTKFDITLGPRISGQDSRILAALDFRARLDLDLALRRKPDGTFAIERYPIVIDTTPLRIRGQIGSNLYRSALAAGAPAQVIQAYQRAISRYLDAERGLAPTDFFDIIVSYRRSAKGERYAGNLLYAAVERAGRPHLQLLRWGDSGEMYPAALQRQAQAKTALPVAGRRTSGFGLRRHPILGYTRMHAGVDYAAAYGAPIYAVTSGKVLYAGRHGGHGNYVRLEHPQGLGTGYAHMSRIAVSPGSVVHAGQIIGYVGSSGLSTGAHLHFEVYRNGQAINPANLALNTQIQLKPKDREAFRAWLKALMTIEPGAALGSLSAEKLARTHIGREIDLVS